MAITTPMVKRFNRRRLRKARGKLTAEAFAVAVGVTKQTVYNWEKGSSEPNAKQLSAIAAATRRSIGWFFEGAA